jgi:hypothetical protein
MNRSTTDAFGGVDRDDRTLTLDGLSEFLSPEFDPDTDVSLAVGALNEFFVEEDTAPPVVQEVSVTPLPWNCDARVDAGGLGDLFTAVKDAPTVTADDDSVVLRQENVAVVQESVAVVDVAPHEPGFQSEIQRAAIDFQRFAERFHTFAKQCRQPRAAFSRQERVS